MFAIGSIIGFYSYIIFFLGLLHLLYIPIIVIITLAFFGAIISSFYPFFSKIRLSTPKTTFICISLTLIFIQILVNYVGALGPELGFDALWYHLTLPKLFLQNHSIFHIGGVLYYSDMPKLVEMLYIPALAFGNEIVAKNIHFFFGILCIVALFLMGKKLFGEKVGILACLIFYANLVVGFESITAYVDLGRTFFELLAFWSFTYWVKEKKMKWLIVSAMFVGLCITTKLLAVGTLLLFLILIAFVLVQKRYSFLVVIKYTLIYSMTSLVIPLPWFIFSFVQTGNFFYPLFTAIYPVHIQFSQFNPISYIFSLFSVLLHADDPLSPIYFIILPVILLQSKKIFKTHPLLLIYSFLATIIWFLTPQTGGGRFILVYLPLFSLLTSYIILEIAEKNIKKILIVIVFVLSCTSIIYRGAANSKFIPVIFGEQTKSQFLATHLNFNFGDFYDIDGYFSKTIKPKDTVLLVGFHNLYYVNFPFVDSSWARKGQQYNYIITQNTTLSNTCTCWKQVYKNTTTNVIVYKYRKQ